MVSGSGRLLVVLVAVALAGAVGAVAAVDAPSAGPTNASTVETTPVEGGPEPVGDADPETERTVPSTQVPFGIRTMYGQDGLERPAGGDGVTVAVLDTGVDRTHPDLRNRVTRCRDFTGETVREGCADANGHGTHVAGTVAADGGPDGRGVYGVAPAATVHAYKICDDEGRCPTGAVAPAIRAATDAGADVIVMSLGGREDPRVGAEVQYAASRGVLVVAAAGNSGPDVGSILYPASHPEVVAVAAVGPREEELVAPGNYRVPLFSSRGVEASAFEAGDGYLEVAAPGVGVLSPVPGGGYGRATGTSMAAPHVAGLAAKLLAAEGAPDTAGELRATLRERAPRYDVLEGQHARAGYDPAAGLGVPTVAPIEARFTVSPSVPNDGETFALEADASESPDSDITTYEWDTTGDGAFDRTGRRVEVTRPAGVYRVRLRVTDDAGNTGTATRAVRVNAPPVAAFAVDPAIPTEGETVRFDAGAAHDPDGDPLSFAWDTTGDGSFDAEGASVDRRFGTAGVRTVRLRATDGPGAAGEATRELLVNDVPAVSVRAPGRVVAGEAATLSAAVENAYGTTTVTWRFPDGLTKTGERVTHRFPEGNSTVEVTVEDEFGAASAAEATVRADSSSLRGAVSGLSAVEFLLLCGLAGAALLAVAALRAGRR